MRVWVGYVDVENVGVWNGGQFWFDVPTFFKLATRSPGKSTLNLRPLNLSSLVPDRIDGRFRTVRICKQSDVDRRGAGVPPTAGSVRGNVTCAHPLPFNCNANLVLNALTFSSEQGATLVRRLLRDLWLCTPHDHQLETVTTRCSYGSVSVKMSRSLQNKTPLWHDETLTTPPQHCQPPFSSQSKQRLPMRQRSCCHRDALIIATVVGWGTKELQQ